jgi:hypothetical protein
VPCPRQFTGLRDYPRSIPRLAENAHHASEDPLLVDLTPRASHIVRLLENSW